MHCGQHLNLIEVDVWAMVEPIRYARITSASRLAIVAGGQGDNKKKELLSYCLQFFERLCKDGCCLLLSSVWALWTCGETRISRIDSMETYCKEKKISLIPAEGARISTIESDTPGRCVCQSNYTICDS